ncbi:MAG: aldo/keto reductase [Planctomycetaceae bacterium]|nr:aldo/keto reductase [Planctomycetaceae bacterium]
MQYAYLGRTGMKASRLCLGTWNFGTYTDEPEAFRIMDTAIESGINFFDTANHYPDFVNCGRSETFIGRWFAQGGQRREKVVLATKVSQPMKDPLDGPNDEQGLSKYIIRRHAEGSLRRLQTDHIELYQMHHIDRRSTWEEIWEAFEILVHAGKIDYVGGSNFAGWHMAMAQAAAAKRNFFGLASEQHKYGLMCRLPELEVLPAAKALGIGVLSYSPLHGGLLSGHVLKTEPGSRIASWGGCPEHLRGKLEAYEKLCRELGAPEAAVALAWVLAHPAMTSVVIGPRTAAQVTTALRALEVSLDESAMKRLDELFPGPGGQTPEAYAW